MVKDSYALYNSTRKDEIMSNPLGLSPEDLKEIDSIKDEVKENDLGEDAVEVDMTEPDEGFEAPRSSFWENEEEGTAEAKEGEQSLETPEELVNTSQPETVYKYKSGGKEYEIDLSNPEHVQKALKALELQTGSRKAFSEKAKLKREVDKYKKEFEEAKKFKEVWEELAQYKDDPKALFEAVSGKDFDIVAAQYAERQRLLEDATEEEKQILQYQTEFEKMRKELESYKKEQQKYKQTIEQKETETQKKYYEGLLVPEFQKYSDFEGVPAHTANRLRKALWNTSLSDIQDYVEQGYQPTQKLISAVFKANGKALSNTVKNKTESKITEMIEEKKKTASEQAQLASQRNYQSDDFLNEISKANPLDLFRAWKKK